MGHCQAAGLVVVEGNGGPPLAVDELPRHDVEDRVPLQRREFLAFASMCALASAAALELGMPTVALADTGGKMAHLMMTLRLEYCANADAGAHGAAKALGLDIVSLDGELDSERQLNQFEQQSAAGVHAVMLHAPGGGSTRRIAELANQNKIWLDNTGERFPGALRDPGAGRIRRRAQDRPEARLEVRGWLTRTRSFLAARRSSGFRPPCACGRTE